MAANNTRENVARNAKNLALEAVKRFPGQKDLCKQFVKSFETDEFHDSKYGSCKYKTLLQRVANRRQETVHINLNDLEQFCKQQLHEPDLQSSLSKSHLQLAIEDMLSDIESNAFRYMRYFIEACDSQFPDKDGDFDGEGTGMAKDTIKKWRERQIEKQQEEGGSVSLADIPMQLKHNLDIRFEPRTNTKTMKLREINAKHVGALVQLDCIVLKVSQVKPRMQVVTYHCDVCGAEVFQNVESEQYTPLKECPSQRCKDNKQQGKLNCNTRTSKFVRYQEMRVQELSEHVPTGGVPRSINVILGGDLTRSVLPGEAIQLTGVYAPLQMPWFQARKTGTMQEMFIDAHFVRKHKNGYNEQDGDQHQFADKVEEAYQRGNLYDS